MNPWAPRFFTVAEWIQFEFVFNHVSLIKENVLIPDCLTRFSVPNVVRGLNYFVYLVNLVYWFLRRLEWLRVTHIYCLERYLTICSNIDWVLCQKVNFRWLINFIMQIIFNHFSIKIDENIKFLRIKRHLIKTYLQFIPVFFFHSLIVIQLWSIRGLVYSESIKSKSILVWCNNRNNLSSICFILNNIFLTQICKIKSFQIVIEHFKVDRGSNDSFLLNKGVPKIIQKSAVFICHVWLQI